ncbi:RteC domain-containing protein [Christiangramia sp. LLG6405-1]|uniref:RteC domain-containing protein n=1 Tax=Christiangramia sp. LLG6405-1 TaxID=3160832 RepID=UPI0038703306
MFEEAMNLFTDKLDQIIKSSDSHLKKADYGIRLCNDMLSSLQSKVEKEDFEDPSSEIDFFKNIKPFPMSYLIYFTEVRSCELTIPKAGVKHKIHYLEKEIKKVNKFFAQNNDFVHYMEQNHEYLDHQFFTRNFRNDFPFTPTINYYQYPEFSTSHDMLWAKVQALYRLIHYIRESLQKLQPGNTLIPEKTHKLLLWSGSKTALVELIYALYSSGDLNHGTVDLQTISTSFEDIFNVKLDNIYKTYSEIKARKSNRTKYLTQLITQLERKMQRDDEA